MQLIVSTSNSNTTLVKFLESQRQRFQVDQFLFLKTLLPAAGSATTTFFPAPTPPAAAPAFFNVDVVFVAVAVVVVAVAAAFLACAPPRKAIPILLAAFFTTVVLELLPLRADELLDWLTLRSCAVRIGRGGGSILVLAGDVVASNVVVLIAVLVFSRDAVRESLPAVVAVPRFACSTMP